MRQHNTAARRRIAISRAMYGLRHTTSWLPTIAANFLWIQKLLLLQLAYCMEVS